MNKSIRKEVDIKKKPKADSMCHRCKNAKATKFYGSSQTYPSCEHCYNHLNDEFDEEYR